MKDSTNRRAAVAGCWITFGSVMLAMAIAGVLRAQEPAGGTTRVTPLPSKLTALLPKSRQLQFDGDLRAAEQVARFDLKHHTNVSQLAGSLETLTSVYKQSGRYEEAFATGNRYQQVLETIPNADPSKRQDMALLLAEILAGLGKYPQAVEHVDEALKIAGGWRETDPLWEPHAFALRAQIQRAAGQIDAAGADWREVESRARKILDRVNHTLPNVELEEAALKLLTEALVSTDRTQDAIAVREQFLARHQDDQTRARNWLEIAKCYALLQQFSQEEHALREALNLETRDEAREKELRSSAERADLMDRLGLVLAHQGDADGAQRQWKEAATIYERLIAARTHVRDPGEQRLSHLAKLQAIYERSSQWQNAIRVAQQMLKQQSRTLLPDDPNLWRTKSTLGGLYAPARDVENARSLLTDALAYWRTRVPPATGELAQTLAQLSKMSLSEGDRPQATAYAEEAVKVCQQAPAGHELQLAEAEDHLADVLAAEGHDQAALDHYRQAAQICRDRPNDRRASVQLCATLVDVATLYKSQHQYRRAAEYCEQALEVRKQTSGKDAGSLIGLYTALASMQLAEEQDKHPGKDDSAEVAEAEKNIQAARKLCEEKGLIDGPAGIGVLELEAVVDVRRERLDAARKSLDAALALARKSQHRALEAKILTELAAIEARHVSSTPTSP